MKRPSPWVRFMAAPGVDELLAVGVVSVSRRNLVGPFPAKLDPPPERRRGRAARGARQRRSVVAGTGSSIVEGRARAAAGVQVGDVILSVAETPLRDHADLAACVRDHWGRRASGRPCHSGVGKPLCSTMTLRADPGSTPFSGRSDDFPTVLEHDLHTAANENGGPLVDRHGKVVGVTVATGPVGGMAVPADCVRKLLPDLLSGKRRDVWNKAAPESIINHPVGNPVKMTVEDLKQKLKERSDRFKSKCLRRVRPHGGNKCRAAVAQGELGAVHRPRRTRNGSLRAAIAGKQRATRVTVTGDRPYLAPEEEITLDPRAPRGSGQDQIEQRRQVCRLPEGSRGDATTRLLAIGPTRSTSFVFDGESCFAQFTSFIPFSKCPPEAYANNCMYLDNAGIRPGDPKPSPEQRRAQQQFRFPDFFDLYETCRVRPTEESVDGRQRASYSRAERHQIEKGNRRSLYVDKIWLDPEIGPPAPRKWEQWIDGVLSGRRSSSEFEEVAPGCWLPWETAAVGVASPAFGRKRRSFATRCAFSYRMKVRKLRVNDVPDAVFKPPTKN